MKLILLFLSVFIVSAQMSAFEEHSCENMTKEASHDKKEVNSDEGHDPAEPESNNCDCPDCICNLFQARLLILNDPLFEYIDYVSSSLIFYYLPPVSSSFIDEQIKPPIS